MKIKLTFEYEEQYLPTPRCRKLRTRIVEGTATATIKEITEDKAPIACIVHDGFDFYCEPGPDGHFPKKVYPLRYHKNTLYKRIERRNWINNGEGFATLDDLAQHLGRTKRLNSYDERRDFASKRKEQIRDCRDYLIIDGEVWRKCGEPMYLVMTFGLGHNHGGTSGFIEYHYNPNVSKNNYFNAKDYAKAKAYGKDVALRRGDTEYVDRILKEEYIDVKIPEAFKANPQKEHGDGDPFLNSLEDIINGSASQGEAAFGVMAATLMEVGK